MKITIVYDNATCKEGLQSGWGFSCLVDQRVLFDTGENGGSLFYNMSRLNMDISKIEAVVISHNHWDHTGGLWELLGKREGLRVYGCPGFGDDFKRRVIASGGTLIESDKFREIDARISVTGKIAGQYKGSSMPEQALMVKTESGITVVTGCSHPGILTMIQKVRSFFPKEPIVLAVGGFHLMDLDRSTVESIVASMEDLGVLKVGPTHCSGRYAETVFQERYGKHFIPIGAGKQLEI